MRNKKIYEISVCFRSGEVLKRELLFCVLAQCGIPQKEIVESDDLQNACLSFFSVSREKVYALQQSLCSASLKGVTLQTKTLNDADWKTKWKSEFVSFMLTSDLRIVPAWMAAEIPVRKGKTKDILIDTELVFGTGTHPTTHCVAQYIFQKKRHISSFLDIGTGTGILALVAASYGVSELWCYDIEKEAIKTARKNLSRNAFRADVLEVSDFRDVAITRQFDFVAANIITNELIKMRRKIIGRVKKGKYLAVSGIATVNYKNFRKAFDDERLRCLRVQKKDGWTGLLYKRIR